MRVLLISVFDSKTGVYSPPMVCKTRGEALRTFEDACKDPNLPFSKHLADYALYVLGGFDDNSGELLIDGKPVRMIGADELGI